MEFVKLVQLVKQRCNQCSNLILIVWWNVFYWNRLCWKSGPDPPWRKSTLFYCCRCCCPCRCC